MKLVAPWLPGGSVELGPIPIKGEFELKKMDETTSVIRALWQNENSLNLGLAILAADKVLANLGAAKAKESWDEYMVVVMAARGVPIKDFIWPEADFAKNLTANKERVLYRQLGAKDNDEAQAKLDEFAKKLVAEAEAIKAEDIDILNRKPLVSLYWRLRAAGVQKFLLPDGETQVEWSLRPEIRAKVLDQLAEVVTKEQLESLNEKSDKTLDMEDLKPTSATEVLGKSSGPSVAWTESAPTLQPSSEKVAFSVTSEATVIP